jgi:hypothetical protein
MISTANIGISPQIQFTYTGSGPYTWTMTYTMSGGSFTGATNNGSYGFILQISMIL